MISLYNIHLQQHPEECKKIIIEDNLFLHS